MCEIFSSQGVSTVKRIMVRRNDILVPTNTFILTFRKHTLPQSIKAGYLNIPVDLYVPNPLHCFKCQKYGHGQNTCRNKMTCACCGQIDHDSKSCKNYIQCVNCNGNHFAYSREYARWKVEKRVQQLKVEKHYSFYEARKLVEASAPVATGPSYAAVVKTFTKSISINTDLTWCYQENKYKNVADVETLQRQTAKTSKKQKEKEMNKTTQVSLDSRRLSTLVPGPSLPQPGKDTKSNNKHRGSGRLKKAEKALVPISNSFETLDVDRIEIDPNCRHIQMINSVIQWNCHGLRPNFDELSLWGCFHSCQ